MQDGVSERRSRVCGASNRPYPYWAFVQIPYLPRGWSSPDLVSGNVECHRVRCGAALRGLNCPLGQHCSSKLVRSTNKNVDRSALSDFRWASSRLSVILFLITGRLLSICADFEGQGPVQGGSSNTQVFPKRSSNDRTGNSVRCEVDQPKTGASTRTNRSTGSSRQRSRISVHRTSIRHILGSKKCLTTYRRQGRPYSPQGSRPGCERGRWYGPPSR